MRKGWFLVAALAVMTLAAPAAWAQRGGGRGGFGGGGTLLLGQKSVQTELKLTDEQTAKVTAHLEKQRGSFAELRDLSREERGAKMREQATANDAALKEILTADQLKRLKQITLQQRGPSALADDEVADAVGLTAEQKEKVRSINSEMRGLFQGGGGEDREAMRKKFEEARASTRTKLEALLTPEQQTKWKELTGEPFKGEIQRPQGRRNRAASLPLPRTGQLISLAADTATGQDDDTWNEVAQLLNAEPRAAQFGLALHRGETPVQLVGVHKPPKPNPAKMRRKVHRQNQRHAHWSKHHSARPQFAPHSTRDDQVVLSHRRPNHHASHHHRGPRHHHFARFEQARHGYAGHHRHHGGRGPQVARFGHHPGHRHFAARPYSRHHQFAGRPYHRPHHSDGWSRDFAGADRGHFAFHHGPQRDERFGHGPRGEFSRHRPGGHHFHMSSWRRHGDDRQDHRRGDHPRGDRDKHRHEKDRHEKHDKDIKKDRD